MKKIEQFRVLLEKMTPEEKEETLKNLHDLYNAAVDAERAGVNSDVLSSEIAAAITEAAESLADHMFIRADRDTAYIISALRALECRINARGIQPSSHLRAMPGFMEHVKSYREKLKNLREEVK